MSVDFRALMHREMKSINVNPQYFATLVGQSIFCTSMKLNLWATICSNLFLFVSEIVSLMGLLDGITLGWLSPAIFLFTSAESTLSTGQMTSDQASWVSSLAAAGFFGASIFVGTLANNYGRKWPLILMTIPSIVSWALIYSAKNVYFLYVARVLQGFVSAGTFSFGQLYLIEISSHKYDETIP